MVLWKHELKMNVLVLLIWSGCIGLICFGCLLLFESFADSMKQMSGMFAQMGFFAAALGMDRMNIGTIEGFFATEIALMVAIGGAMFAAMTGAAMLSKEEEGHTGEFLYALPLKRKTVVGWKYLAMASLVVMFEVICIVFELAGFAAAGEMPDLSNYCLFHETQFLMHLEVGSICFLISAVSKKKQLGAALGLAILLYMADMLCRIIPALENLKYVTPYYFCNAADIFADGRVDSVIAVIGAGVTVLAGAASVFVYERKDLAS